MQGQEQAPQDTTRVTLALQALEETFKDLSDLRGTLLGISNLYGDKTCKHLQSFQVLSYDYLDQIQDQITREEKLHKEISLKSMQIGEMKEMIVEYKRIINKLTGHIKEQKYLKEA